MSSIHALFLTTTSTQQDIVRLFAKHCSRYENASSFAQAAAIFSKSTDVAISLPPINLIVADVPAGGINLAEYVLGRIRPTTYFRSAEFAAKIVVFDMAGDVAAARRALQIGVTDYLLADDLQTSRIDTLMHTWAAAGYFDKNSTGNSAGNGTHHNGESYEYELEPEIDHTLRGARLSSVEAAILSCLSARSGEPMSARGLVNAIMGRDVDEEHAASLIRPHISRLRSKLEPIPQMPRKLLTVRGKGYLYIGE